MKLINKGNFISIICISFTVTVCCKLLIEKLAGFTDTHYTGNIFTILAFSVLITSVLALHFYLQRFPLVPVLLGQYAAVIAAVIILVRTVDRLFGTSTEAMWQMLLSVTIPFAAAAAVYYIAFFRSIKKANEIISGLGQKEDPDAEENEGGVGR